MSSLTRQFASALHNLAGAPIPARVLHQAKRCLLDYLGVAIVGSHELQTKLLAILDQVPSVAGGVSAIGLGRKTSVETAALVNGLSSHAAEMDDGARFGMIHPGAPTISALLPTAQNHQADGEQLLRGIIIGYEAALRLSSSVQPSHYHRGYHPTATCGAVGAATGIAGMLGFDSEQFESAIAAAAISAGGTLKVVEDGSEMKPLNAGHAAVNAVVSTMIARAGFHAPPAALEGPTGFLGMMCDCFDENRLIQPCSEGYWIEKIYVKPYAACRHAHPAIEACLLYRDENHARVTDIHSIVIRTYGGLAGRHDKQEVSDVPSARMSIPVSCAIALAAGAAGVAEFQDSTLTRSDVRKLAKKISVIKDDAIHALLPGKRIARVEFSDSHGNSKEILIEDAKGEPENPLSDDELEKKFRNLTTHAGKSDAEIRATIAAVMNLPKTSTELYALL